MRWRLSEELLAEGTGGARVCFPLASLDDVRAEGLEGAVELYRAGLGEDPGTFAARNNLAVVRLALGRPAESAARLTAVAVAGHGKGWRASASPSWQLVSRARSSPPG